MSTHLVLSLQFIELVPVGSLTVLVLNLGPVNDVLDPRTGSDR